MSQKNVMVGGGIMVRSGLGVFIGVMVLAHVSHADIRPSFALDYASWQATEIAVVDEGDAIDGRLTVIESLQGDLKKGEVIVAPTLKKFIDESWRTTGHSLFRGIVQPRNNSDTKPVVMTGRSMIVFLQHPPKGMSANALKRMNQVTVDGRADQLWIPAGFGGMETSTVWIENGKAFAFVRGDGASVLRELRVQEKTVPARIRKLVAAQEDLNQIEKMKDKAAAAKQAAAYINDDCELLREHAFRVLGHCGQPSLTTLLQILADPEKIGLHDEAVGAIALVDGSEVDATLTELFEQEIALWQKLGPTLQRGWWQGTGLDGETVRQHHDQYGRTLAYVHAFQKRPVTQARNPLDRFRLFWRSLPQLESPSDNMGEACDSAIRAIDKNSNR